MIRHPLPSTGFSRREFPGFHGTTGCSDAPPSFRPHFVSFAWPYHVPAAVSCAGHDATPAGPRRLPDEPGVCSAGCPVPALNVETMGPPRFLGDPCVHALAFDPGGTAAPSPYGASVLPSAVMTASAPAISTFRGSIPRPAHSLSTPRLRGLLPVCARLATGCRLRLPGGLVPAESHYKVYMLCLLHCTPPCPGFAWRTMTVVATPPPAVSSAQRAGGI